MFQRFFLLGVTIECIFSLICIIGGLRQLSIGLWPLVFTEIVIECMTNAEQSRPLCCFPVLVKAKYYPFILIGVFTLFFGFELSFFVGFGVGYLYHYGMFTRLELGATTATKLENKFPFKQFLTKMYFYKAGSCMGGEILPAFGQQAP